MTVLDSLQIQDLLKEREQYFVQIYESERAIEAILGHPFQGWPLFDLPSLAKVKSTRGKPAPSALSVSTSATPPSLRRLKKDNEHAYCVDYLYQGNMARSIQRSAKLLQLLLTQTDSDFVIQRIGTVFYIEPQGYQEVALLYERPPMNDTDCSKEQNLNKELT